MLKIKRFDSLCATTRRRMRKDIHLRLMTDIYELLCRYTAAYDVYPESLKAYEKALLEEKKLCDQSRMSRLLLPELREHEQTREKCYKNICKMVKTFAKLKGMPHGEAAERVMFVLSRSSVEGTKLQQLATYSRLIHRLRQENLSESVQQLGIVPIIDLLASEHEKVEELTHRSMCEIGTYKPALLEEARAKTDETSTRSMHLLESLYIMEQDEAIPPLIDMGNVLIKEALKEMMYITKDNARARAAAMKRPKTKSEAKAAAARKKSQQQKAAELNANEQQAQQQQTAEIRKDSPLALARAAYQAQLAREEAERKAKEQEAQQSPE